MFRILGWIVVTLLEHWSCLYNSGHFRVEEREAKIERDFLRRKIYLLYREILRGL